MKSSQTTYDSVSKTLHWVTAAAILVLLALGWTMGDLEDGPAKLDAYQWHKSIGIAILALTLFRVMWRLAKPALALPDSMRTWEKWAAKLVHFGFYVLLVLLPLTGWAMVSSMSFPTLLFGFIPLPNLPVIPDLANKSELGHMFKETHEMMAALLVGLLALHIGAALKHHFINHDDVLLRMMPSRRRGCCCGKDKAGPCC